MNEQRHEVSFSRANGGMSVCGLRAGEKVGSGAAELLEYGGMGAKELLALSPSVLSHASLIRLPGAWQLCSHLWTD